MFRHRTWTYCHKGENCISKTDDLCVSDLISPRWTSDEGHEANVLALGVFLSVGFKEVQAHGSSNGYPSPTRPPTPVGTHLNKKLWGDIEAAVMLYSKLLRARR